MFFLAFREPFVGVILICVGHVSRYIETSIELGVLEGNGRLSS